MEFINPVRELLFVALCALASVFAIAGTIGLFRFPDAYTRLQASSLAGTAAVFTLFLASLLVSPDLATAFRVILVIGFFFLSNPTATHIIARFAWKAGIDPWSPGRDP